MRALPRRDLRTFGIGVASGFVAGAAVAWLVLAHEGRASAPRRDLVPAMESRSEDGLGPIDAPPAPPVAAATGGHALEAPPAPDDATAVRELDARDLAMPVEGVSPDQLTRTYHDARSGGREHEALDILAPRNTPVTAVEDGQIARLFHSKAGGITVYQFDPSGRFCYYYAHLERYANGLHEGDRVHRGQVLGYVGTSGNAPENTPHLHFAVFRLTADRHWWEGVPLDPYDILR